MTASGVVVVKISPFEAGEASRWLRSRPIPLMGVPASNYPLLANGVRVSLVEFLEAISRRKRATGSMVKVNIEIDRIDASWLGAQSAGGMFGSTSRLLIPAGAKSFFLRCRIAGSARRGRPKLNSLDLSNAVNRAGIDPRHRKRLKKREREQQAVQNAMEAWGGILGRNLLQR